MNIKPKNLTFILIYIFVLICAFDLKAAEKSSQKPPKSAILQAFLNFHPEELVSDVLKAKENKELICTTGTRAECNQAQQRLGSVIEKTQEVKEAQKRFTKEAFEFSQEKMASFNNETDLIQQLDKVMTKEPLKVFKSSHEPIYFIRFSSPSLQEAAFARFVIFVEENRGIVGGQYPEGPADGHDYRISDLARFFNESEKSNGYLNPIEKRLLESLLKSGMLQKHRDEGTKRYTYIATESAALVSTGANHRPTVSHELNHAVYFTDSKYRDHISKLYEKGLSPAEKQFVDKVMKDLGGVGRYDFKNDKDLFLTEIAAFFRDPDELWGGYLKKLNYPEAEKAKIQAITKKVKALDGTASFYRISETPAAAASGSSQ